MSEEIVRDTVSRMFGIPDVLCDGFANMLDSAPDHCFSRLAKVRVEDTAQL